MHSLDFFEVGKTLKRIRYDVGTRQEKTSYVFIKDAKTAAYHHDLQDEYLRYDKNEPRRTGYKGDAGYKYQPVIKIHDSGLDSTCIACEG